MGGLGSIRKPPSAQQGDSSFAIWSLKTRILDKNIIQEDACTPMFIAALFTIAQTGKQPKSPSMDKEDVVHKHNGILLSHKKEQNSAVCSYMDGTSHQVK